MSALPQAPAIRKILVLALGGEGGGTLTEWLVSAGLDSGWPIQATSIPGVAQRTGATSYYIECLPLVPALGQTVPPMCLAPLPGDLDLIISSELLESARAIERGLADPRRTVMISSTARAFTVDERGGMADGRLPAQKLISALQEGSARVALFDMGQLAREQGTIVSAVMFGALAGAGVLPLTRAACEKAVAGGAADGRAQASLRGFAAGFERAVALLAGAPGAPASDPIEPPRAGQRPEGLAQIRALGMARLVDYQDRTYAERYAARVDALARGEPAPHAASCEAARGLALWMSYEDIIRVADLKSRRSRFEQIRRDYKAGPGEPLIVRDFLKPGVEEIAAILPPRWASRLKDWGRRRQRVSFGEGVQLATSSVTGLLAMRLLASLRWLRPRSSRFIAEQALIERWLSALQCCQRADAGLAAAVAALPRLIKGYGSTHERGQGSFRHILEQLVEPGLASAGSPQAFADLALRIREAQRVALAQPEGHELFRLLGMSPPAPREQTLHFTPPARRRP